jgi:hypothetical protein
MIFELYSDIYLQYILFTFNIHFLFVFPISLVKIFFFVTIGQLMLFVKSESAFRNDSMKLLCFKTRAQQAQLLLTTIQLIITDSLLTIDLLKGYEFLDEF